MKKGIIYTDYKQTKPLISKVAEYSLEIDFTGMTFKNKLKFMWNITLAVFFNQRGLNGGKVKSIKLLRI